MPQTLVLAELDAAEVAPVDVRDAVVLGKPLVQEGVVGAQEIEHAAILPEHAFEEHLGLAAERLTQVVVEIWEQTVDGPRALQVAKIQPLGGEVVDERLGTLVGQHAAHMALDDRRILSARAPSPSSDSYGLTTNTPSVCTSVMCSFPNQPRCHL